MLIKLKNSLSMPLADGEDNTLRLPNSTNLHLHGLHVYPEGRQDNVFLRVDPGIFPFAL